MTANSGSVMGSCLKAGKKIIIKVSDSYSALSFFFRLFFGDNGSNWGEEKWSLQFCFLIEVHFTNQREDLERKGGENAMEEGCFWGGRGI